MLCCLGIYTLDLTSSKLCSTLMHGVALYFVMVPTLLYLCLYFLPQFCVYFLLLVFPLVQPIAGSVSLQSWK